MTLRDLILGAWAIEPDMLRELQAIYATHLRGDKIDIAAIEARLGRPLAHEQQDYTLEPGGVALLRLSGVMAPKANLFMRVSGGISTQLASRQLESAAADPRVRGIIVAMDTPGGNVVGVPEFADTVRYAAAAKPLVVHTDNQLCSAGYWAASAANAIYISGPVCTAGSIGVVVDREYDPQSRYRTESIAAGRYKRLAQHDAPLSDEARAVVQADVDYVYTLFVDAVAANRSVTPEEVLEHMADGRVFRGQQAHAAGLVDGVSTLDDLLQAMATDPAQFAARRKAVFAAAATLPSPSAGAAPKDTTPTREKEPHMPEETKATPLTRASFEQEHAALYAQVRAEFTTLGATQERERIQAVLAVGDGLPGHEALLSGLAFDGKTSAADASLAVLAAEKQQRAAAIAVHAADAPDPAKPSAAPADTAKTKAEQIAEAQAYAKDKGVDLVVALKALGHAR
jgi:signal peptide peptidase SppA